MQIKHFATALFVKIAKNIFRGTKWPFKTSNIGGKKKQGLFARLDEAGKERLSELRDAP